MFLLIFYKMIKNYLNELLSNVTIKDGSNIDNDENYYVNKNTFMKYKNKSKLLHMLETYEFKKTDYFNDYIKYFNIKISWNFSIC